MHLTELNQQFIGGAWRDGRLGRTLVDRNPYDGSQLAVFELADVHDVDEAYRAAESAQRAWEVVNPFARREILESAARFVAGHVGDITELILGELGGTRLKAAFEIGLVLDIIKEAATFPLRMDGRILPSTIDDTENRLYRRPAAARALWNTARLAVLGVPAPDLRKG